MLLGEFKASFSHGLLIMEAPESIDTHENWDAAAETVHAGPDSIYCSVQQTASGLVSVSCFEGSMAETSFSVVFSGQLELPSARLQFYDPNETIKMILSVAAKSVMITVYANEDEEPSELLVHVTGVIQ